MAAPTLDAPSRTCNVTGFVIEREGQRLSLAYLISGLAMLAIGGFQAILIALQRQGLPMSDDWWYRLLASHGTTMLLFWLILFEVGLLYWGSTMLLNTRMRVPKLAWANFVMMIVGIALAQWMMLAGEATVMFTAYPPLTAHPLYYAGVLMFAVGMLLACGIFVANVLGAKREGSYEGSLPLVVYGLMAGAVIAVYALGTGAVAYGMLLLQSIGLMELVDPATYRLFFWGIGHGAQQVNLAIMVAVWYALIGFTLGGRPVNEGLSRAAFLLYIAFIHLGAVHHLLVDPGLGTSHRIMNTSYMLYLAVLASLIHAFSIPASMEISQREAGHRTGLLTWLKKLPWREPGVSSLVLSVVYFGFIAGTSGVLMGTMQLNMVIHNTLFTVGHFHATVVSGTTLAFMGISYYLIPLLTQRNLTNMGMARIQPYVFAGGVAVLTLGMMLAGQLGVPRRVSDLDYEGAQVAMPLFEAGAVPLVMVLVSLGAVVAVIGGIQFIWIIAMTLLKGERSEQPDAGLGFAFRAGSPLTPRERPGAAPEPVGQPAGTATATAERPAADGEGSEKLGMVQRMLQLRGRWATFEAPGTYFLVLVFLGWFVVLYLAAHLNLSQAWPVG